ncbi:MAG: hypothetical protein IV100_27810 [Myxococcales bacterium]|nr:hypothetical protein [Myxococcales bacterium]
MNERTGAAILKQVFEGRGFTISEDVPLGDPPVVLDGYDHVAKVGYEWITTEAGDREEFTPAAIAVLEARIAAGELHLLLIDETEAVSEGDLVLMAERFIDMLRAQGRVP